MLWRLIRRSWTRAKSSPARRSAVPENAELDASGDPAAKCLEVGNTLKGQRRLSEALNCYRACAESYPSDLRIRAAIANTLSASWRMDECIAACAEALAIEPERTEVFSGYLLYSHYAERVQPRELFELHRRYGTLVERLTPPRFNFSGRDRNPERRLRIGYVSRDFCTHSVASFIEPVIARHHRARFEVYAYYTRASRDAMTDRVAMLADAWREVHADDSDALARRIYSDAIDVLVDLGGHTPGNRLAVFARRPAPVQMTWIGYPDTTGLSTMDYRVTDEIADPPGGADERHTERLLRVPSPFVCYSAPADAPPIKPRERRQGVVFGSFNMIMKVNERLIELWARILQAVPDSRLVVKSALLEYEETSARLRARFAAHGIDPARVELRARELSRARHLTAYSGIDIALDSFPYNGTTTTCEALWMGVPVVSLCGEIHMSRVGASLLAAAGLRALVASDPDEYVATAVALARDSEKRAALSRGIRERMSASPLMDAAAFTSRFESALRQVWSTWCRESALSATPHRRSRDDAA